LLLAQKQEDYNNYYDTVPTIKPKPAPQAKTWPKPLMVAIVLVAFLSGLFMISKYVQLSMLGTEINQVKKQIDTLKNDNERLQLEIAKLNSPERVAVIASTRLGMREPNLKQFKLVTPLPEQPTAAIKLVNQPTPEGSENLSEEMGFVRAITHWVSHWVGGVSEVEASPL